MFGFYGLLVLLVGCLYYLFLIEGRGYELFEVKFLMNGMFFF